MELERFWKLVPEKEALAHLTRSQAQSIFRLLMISAFADREVTPPERIALAQAITRLPFFDPENWHMFDDARGVKILADLHTRYADPDEFPALMEEIAEGLGDAPTRTLALKMVARFLQPDGFEQDEYDFCLMVGQALGIDEERVATIVEDAWDFAERP